MTGFLRRPVEATGRTAAGRNSKISAASAPQRPPTTKVPPPGPLHNAMVTTTPGARERYVYSTIGDSVTVASSPGNTSGNLRVVFWRGRAPESTDQQVCMRPADPRWSCPTRARITGCPSCARAAGEGDRCRPERVRACILADSGHHVRRDEYRRSLEHEADRDDRTGHHGPRDHFLSRRKSRRRAAEWPLARLRPGDRSQARRSRSGARAAPEPDSSASAKPVHTVMLPVGDVYPGYAGGYIGHVRPGRCLRFRQPGEPGRTSRCNTWKNGPPGR